MELIANYHIYLVFYAEIRSYAHIIDLLLHRSISMDWKSKAVILNPLHLQTITSKQNHPTHTAWLEY